LPGDAAGEEQAAGELRISGKPAADKSTGQFDAELQLAPERKGQPELRWQVKRPACRYSRDEAGRTRCGRC
jgi:hypothetical protein